MRRPVPGAMRGLRPLCLARTDHVMFLTYITRFVRSSRSSLFLLPRVVVAVASRVLDRWLVVVLWFAGIRLAEPLGVIVPKGASLAWVVEDRSDEKSRRLCVRRVFASMRRSLRAPGTACLFGRGRARARRAMAMAIGRNRAG